MECPFGRFLERRSGKKPPGPFFQGPISLQFLLDVTGLWLKIFSRSSHIFRNDIFYLFVTHAHSFVFGSLSFKKGFSSSGGSGSVSLFRKVSNSVSFSLGGVSSLLYCSL